MEKRKRILSLLLAVCVFAMSLPLTAMAADSAFSDIQGHWAEKVIEEWSKYDVVHGDDGKFRPNDSMTRGEFATVITNLLGLEEKGKNPFQDITGKEWYADAVLKANAAGILLGNGKGHSNATAKIQRQEAFVMVGRVLGVVPESNTSEAIAGFNDKGKVSKWAQPMVAALVKGGYVNGVADATLAPLANINRASIMQLFGATVKTYITEPGSYTADPNGFVVVKTPGNISISGDNAGIVVGAGSKGAKITVSSAKVKDGAKIGAPNATVTLDHSDIHSVVTLSPSAKNTSIVVPAGTTVEKIVTEADSVTVSGEGEVKTVEVAAGDKVNVSTPGTAVTVDKDAGSSVTAGGQTVKPGGSATTSGSSQGYEENSGGGGGGGFVPSTPMYTIEYYVNGAKKETKTVAQSDEAKAPAPTTPTAPGYTFGATWYTDEGCATAYDDSKTIKEILGENGGTTLKLYIKGTPITYTVHFDSNGGSGSMSDMTSVAYNTTDTLTANGFTKTGHTFQGWATSAGGQKAYDDEAPAKELTATGGATVTLYAVWQPNTYTVTYNGNGNTGGAVPGQQSWIFGTPALTAALPGNLEKTGYNFNGWNTQANGGGDAYATGDSLRTLSADITLYAQWSVQQFAVSFETNGGTPVPGSVNVNYGDKVTEPDPAPTKTGYDLMGWYANEEYSGSAWDFANDTVTGATTLHAKWEPKKFAVTFDSKEGSAVDATAYQQVPYNTTIQAPDAPTREGYTFKGWYKENGCTTPWNFTTDTVTGATTLYAKWEKNTYTVTFDTDGGSAVEAQSIEYNEKAAEPAPEPTKEGYEFSGWVTEKGGDAEFNFTNTAITGNTTVYAKWTPVQHTVTYNGNSNTGGTAPANQVWTYGQEEEFVAAQPGDLTKSGSTFVSWNTANDGTGTTYLPGDPIVPTGDITLYAQWIANDADGTITFNGNGHDSGTMANQTYTASAGSLTLTANAFTKKGYSFAGWSRNQDGTGARYADKAILTENPGTITLYAQWVMDVTLRLSESARVVNEGVNYLQENTMLTLEADTAAVLTYKAEGTVKHVGWFQDYFANMDGEKYSKDNAAVIQDDMAETVNPNYDCSGNFLVLDIVDENGKYDNGKTTVSVQSSGTEIVATEKIAFSEVEGKQTATVVVKLDDTRKTDGIQAVVDWDGDGANEPIPYKLDVSAVDLQPAPIVLGETVTAYDDLATDKTVVGKTSGGVDLYPADLVKSLEIADNGETVRATLKYVKDTDAEDGPGYYLTFQVNSPEMDTQPDGLVKLCLNYDWGTGQMDDRNEPNYHEPTLVLAGSDFVKNGNKYTATAVCKVDPNQYDPDRLLAISAKWMADNTWNEFSRPYGVQLTFMPRNTAALMATWDTNEENTDHWPFLLGTDYTDGGRTAQDLFVAGSNIPEENFEIKKLENAPSADQNTTIYNASGYLRFSEGFLGYANSRYPDEAPDHAQGKEPGPNWRGVVSGHYIPVDIVNVNGVDTAHAEAKVYNGPVNEGGQLIYTVPSSAFTRTVQTGNGDGGYPNSATLIQNLKNPDGSELHGSLFIVVDWDTTNDTDTVETLILQLGVQRQRQSRVRVTANDRHGDAAYGEGLRVNQDENFIAGTLVHTTPTDGGDSGYYLPLTFAPWNDGAAIDADALCVLEYRFAIENAEPVALGGSAFNNDGKSHTVLLPVPQAVVNNPRGKSLEIKADWDGRDYTPDGTNSGHLLHGETIMLLDLSNLQFQSQYHLVSAHSRADETRLETVPQDQQAYRYDYVQWPAESDPPETLPIKQETTVTLGGDKFEYQGRRANDLVGEDFRITSDNGDTYYALGLVKYVEGFNSYWYNHARTTFFYIGQTAENVSQEHYAKRELVDAGLMKPQEFEEWRDTHSNAASFGYYLVFDLEKGKLGAGGRIEIHDTAAANGADPVRTITAADFGDGNKLPVVYQLKTKDGPPAEGSTPFANEITISYFDTGSNTADKEISLVLEKTVSEGPNTLYPQPVSYTPIQEWVSDNETQIGMKLQPEKGPCDMKEPPRDWTLTGGILQSQGTSFPYNLTLNFTAPDQWPMIWNPEANNGEGAQEPTPDEAVVIRIIPEEQRGNQLDPIMITKAQITQDPSCVIEGVRRLGGLHIEVNWAGFKSEGWASGGFYIGLWDLVYQEGPVPTYDTNKLGTVVKSKAVTAATQTVTVGETAIDENGATGAPNAFGIVDVNIAYEGLYPKMTSLGEATGHFGAFALKAPEGAETFYAAIRPGMTPFQIMDDFPQWAQEAQDNDWCYYLAPLWCVGEHQQVQGAQFSQLRLDVPQTTIAIQWYSGDNPSSYQPLGSPVYYRITFENTTPQTPVENESPMQLYTVPGLESMSDENQDGPTAGQYQPVLNPEGTRLYLDGCYNASTRTWTPENWQPLRLVSSENPQHDEGYYVELELLAPRELAESGIGDDTVLCTVTGGTMTDGEKIELKKGGLKIKDVKGAPTAWLPVIVKVAANTAIAGTDHGNEVTFTVDWDGTLGNAYDPTIYKLDLSEVALDATPLEAKDPAPAP